MEKRARGVGENLHDYNPLLQKVQLELQTRVEAVQWSQIEHIWSFLFAEINCENRFLYVRTAFCNFIIGDTCYLM